MIRLRALWEYLRRTYWAVPSSMAVAAVTLSIGWFSWTRPSRPHSQPPVLGVHRWAEGARAVLSTIASMVSSRRSTFATLAESAFAEIDRERIEARYDGARAALDLAEDQARHSTAPDR